MSNAGRHNEYHVGFVMEQGMGHVTHHRALAAQVSRDAQLRATWMPVSYHDHDLWQRLPGVRSNMSLLLSLRARLMLSSQRHSSVPFDALLFHTQLTALLSHRAMVRYPTIISLDATPLNSDPHSHTEANGFARRPDRQGPWDGLKFEWYRRAFSRAHTLIAWSDWARRSLVSDYGIDAAKVSVIPPGVDLDLWKAPARPSVSGAKPRLLFVGVDFDRKGGEVLLKAFGELGSRAVLDIVSPEAASLPAETSDIHVHRNLAINSPELRDLYARADVFVLPTLNDCTPLAVLEAMASGLPVIASDVGAIREQVEDGVTGVLVTPGDPVGLARAINSLMTDPQRRRRLGAAGRARAESLFCARRNYSQVLHLLKQCIETSRARSGVGFRRDTGLEQHGRHALDSDLSATGRAWASEP